MNPGRRNFSNSPHGNKPIDIAQMGNTGELGNPVPERGEGQGIHDQLSEVRPHDFQYVHNKAPLPLDEFPSSHRQSGDIHGDNHIAYRCGHTIPGKQINIDRVDLTHE